MQNICKNIDNIGVWAPNLSHAVQTINLLSCFTSCIIICQELNCNTIWKSSNWVMGNVVWAVHHYLHPPLRDPIILITWMSHSWVHHRSWISFASTFHILMCFWGPWWLVGDNFRIDLPSRRKGSILLKGRHIFVENSFSLLSVSWPCKGLHLQCYLGVSGVAKRSISENWRNTLTPISIRDRWWY